jgi:hypothetical protein
MKKKTKKRSKKLRVHGRTYKTKYGATAHRGPLGPAAKRALAKRIAKMLVEEHNPAHDGLHGRIAANKLAKKDIAKLLGYTDPRDVKAFWSGDMADLA